MVGEQNRSADDADDGVTVVGQYRDAISAPLGDLAAPPCSVRSGSFRSSSFTLHYSHLASWWFLSLFFIHYFLFSLRDLSYLIKKLRQILKLIEQEAARLILRGMQHLLQVVVNLLGYRRRLPCHILG